MAVFGSVMKSLISTKPSVLLNTALLRVSSRDHSHSTYSKKRIITPRPIQPQESYYVDYNPRDGLHGWTDWRMKKDYRRRQTVIKYGCERKLINSIRKNDILPREIREVADKEVVDLPPDSNYTRLVMRCCVSSRSRGVAINWRLSRHFFRHLADYNKLSGVQRGIW